MADLLDDPLNLLNRSHWEVRGEAFELTSTVPSGVELTASKANLLPKPCIDFSDQVRDRFAHGIRVRLVDLKGRIERLDCTPPFEGAVRKEKLPLEDEFCPGGVVIFPDEFRYDMTPPKGCTYPLYAPSASEFDQVDRAFQKEVRSNQKEMDRCLRKNGGVLDLKMGDLRVRIRKEGIYYPLRAATGAQKCATVFGSKKGDFFVHLEPRTDLPLDIGASVVSAADPLPPRRELFKREMDLLARLTSMNLTGVPHPLSGWGDVSYSGVLVDHFVEGIMPKICDLSLSGAQAKRFFATQVERGLTKTLLALHKRKIFHNDLTDSNLTVNCGPTKGTLQLFIIDWGAYVENPTFDDLRRYLPAAVVQKTEECAHTLSKGHPGSLRQIKDEFALSHFSLKNLKQYKDWIRVFQAFAPTQERERKIARLTQCIAKLQAGIDGCSLSFGYREALSCWNR